MEAVIPSILAFLETSGIVSGRIPPKYFYCEDIVCVREPVDVVRLGIRHSHLAKTHPFPTMIAGVSIGAHPRECLQTVPDMLLGVLHETTWEWAGDYPGCIINLHAADTFTYKDGLPVWLTFAHCHGIREDLVTSKTKEFDVYEYVVAKRRIQFWESSYEEFIQTTWHPSRLQWCVDIDESREIFSS